MLRIAPFVFALFFLCSLPAIAQGPCANPSNVPDPTITHPGRLCLASPAFNLQAATSGGIWAGPGITDLVLGTYHAATAGIDTHMVIYSVTSTQGCTAKDTIMIIVDSILTVAVDPIVGVCIDAGNFQMNASIGGGNWTGTGIVNNSLGVFSPTSAGVGSHTVYYNVTPTPGCPAADTVQVGVTPLPIADAGPDVHLCNSGPMRIGASPPVSSGTAPYTYSWQPANGLSATNVGRPDANPVATTAYTLLVIDAIGCTDKDTVVVVADPPISLNAGADTTICGGDTVRLGVATTASGGNGGFTYDWQPSASIVLNGLPRPQAFPPGLTFYTVEVTDIEGCTKTDVVRIDVNDLAANAGADRTACAGVKTTLGGAPTAANGLQPYQYLWLPADSLNSTTIANPSITPGISKSFTLLVTDLLGCQDRDTVDLTIAPLPVARAGVDQIFCSGQSVTLGANPAGSAGTAPLSYSWSPAVGLDFSNVPNPVSTPPFSINYSLTVTDANGCVDVDAVKIDVKQSPSANAGADKVACRNAPVVLGGSPVGLGGKTPYTYSWLPSNKLNQANVAHPIATLTNTTAFTLTVTDANGCFDFDTVSVTINANPTVNAGADKTLCFGSAVPIGGTPTATGGISPYTYSWGPVFAITDATAPNPQVSPKVPITYTIVVTDINGCAATDSVTISIAPKPNINTGFTQEICPGVGKAIGGIPTASGGQPPYSYSWLPVGGLDVPSKPRPLASPFVSTTYTLTITDANGCEATDSARVNVFAAPVISAGGPLGACVHDEVVLGGSPLIVSAVPPVNVVWAPSQNLNSAVAHNPILTVGNSQTYTVTVADSNGCVVTGTQTVNSAPKPTVDFSFSGQSTKTLAFVDKSVGATGWEWNFGDGSPANTNQHPVHTFDNAGPYTVCLVAFRGPCSDTVCEQILVGQASSVSEAWLTSWQAGPNPTSGRLALTGIPNDAIVVWYDQQGRMIQPIVHRGGESMIVDLTGLPDGIYLGSIRHQHNVMTFRVVKQAE